MIETKISPTRLTFEGKKYTIFFPPEAPFGGDGFKVEPFKFVGDKGEKADGAFFKIEPGKSLPPMRITYKTHFTEAVIKGSGALITEEEGRVNVIEFTPDLVVNGAVSVVYGGEGCINQWIAGPNGLEVVNITEPAYREGGEVEVDIDDPSVSPKFWEKRRKFLSQAKVTA